MARKKPLDIIASGTPKQRIKLLVEDVAVKKFSGKPILSNKESDMLLNSFNTNEELELFEKWEHLDKVITNSLTNLQGLKFNVLMNFSNLRGYILVWHTIEESELLANSILHQIKKSERIKITDTIIHRNSITFSEVEVDSEGYLDLNIDFPNKAKQGDLANQKYSLRFLINNVKNKTEKSVIQFISWRQALVDYMKKEGFNIKTYNELIKDITDEVHRPIIGWDKYLSSSPSFLNDEKSTRIDAVKKFYSITPDLNNLKVDEDIYTAYTKDHLEK